MSIVSSLVKKIRWHQGKQFSNGFVTLANSDSESKSGFYYTILKCSHYEKSLIDRLGVEIGVG